MMKIDGHLTFPKTEKLLCPAVHARCADGAPTHRSGVPAVLPPPTMGRERLCPARAEAPKGDGTGRDGNRLYSRSKPEGSTQVSRFYSHGLSFPHQVISSSIFIQYQNPSYIFIQSGDILEK